MEFIIICMIILGAITAAIARSKNQVPVFGWFIFGTLFFIIALPAILIAKRLPPDEPTLNEAHEQGLKKCPACAEFVKYEAMICKHCKTSFTYSPVSSKVVGEYIP